MSRKIPLIQEITDEERDSGTVDTSLQQVSTDETDSNDEELEWDPTDPDYILCPNREHANKSSSQNLCEPCNKVFGSRLALALHNGEEHVAPYNPRITDRDRYLCHICNINFRDDKLFKRHIRIHPRQGCQMYICDICDQKIAIKRNLITHMNLHSGENLLECHVCEERFSYEGTFKRHLRIHHIYEYSDCDICGKSFISKSSLARHIQLHTGNFDFSCNTCDKKFDNTYNLNRHKLIHNGSKPFPCDICDKKFTQKTHLIAHSYMHRRGKKWTCKVCKKKFSQKPYLNKHMILHRERKQYSCDICNKKFKEKVYLAKHVTGKWHLDRVNKS